MAVVDMNETMLLPVSAPKQAFFGVYDGHNGDACASMLSKRLHINLARADDFVEDPPTAFVRAFIHTDKVFLRKQAELEMRNRMAMESALLSGAARPAEFKFSGSTALAMLVRREMVPRMEVLEACDTSPRTQMELVPALRLYVAHVGDCRAVLSDAGVAVDLTSDHKPSTRPDEVKRIEAAGGWVHNGRLHGVLAVSRAFGDAEHKTLKERFWEREFSADPLIAEPDLLVHTVQGRDEFVVLACDGVWDVMTSQQVVNFVRRKLREHGDVQRATEQLIQKAIALSSVDNVSAFVVVFHQFSPTAVTPVVDKDATGRVPRKAVAAR